MKLDDEAERKLLPVAEQPLKDIIVLMRDTGMRNARELYRMRVENIDWNSCVIFNPNSKTVELPLSKNRKQRFGDLLSVMGAILRRVG